MSQRNRRMFWLLARAHRNVAARADARLADLGLTITQAGALFCFGEEGLLIGELGDALELAQSAASGLAKRLEEAGLVARQQEKGDGRAARLRLTALGSQRRAEAARRAVVAKARLLQGFSEREIDVVVRWLTQVADTSMPGKSSKEK
jgi:DNA-binding MarR family transcriptional regulator